MNLFIVGYFDFDNYGDDWIKRKLHTWLSNQNHYYLFLKPYHRGKLNLLVRHILRSDTILFGGGSLLQNVSSRKSLFFYLGIIIIAHLFKKNILLLNQGIGPIQGFFDRWITKKILALSSVTYVSVRDSESLSFFNEVQNNISTSYSTDVVFYAQPVSKRPRHQILAKHIIVQARQTNKPWLSKSLINTVSLHYPDKKFIHLIANQNECLLAPFIKTKVELLGHLDFPILFSITERYHSCLWSAFLGIPFIAVSYDKKVDSLSKILELPCIPIGKFTPKLLIKHINDILENYYDYQDNLYHCMLREKERFSLPSLS